MSDENKEKDSKSKEVDILSLGKDSIKIKVDPEKVGNLVIETAKVVTVKVLSKLIK